MKKVEDPNERLNRLFRDLENVRKGKAVADEPTYIREGDHLSVDIPSTVSSEDSDT